MPEQRKLTLKASDVRNGDLIPRSGAAPAKVLGRSTGTKYLRIRTDADERPLTVMPEQEMTILREFPTKDEEVERLRERLRKQLDKMKHAEEKALASFVSLAKKGSIANALERVGQEMISASVETDLAVRIAKAYEYHQHEEATDTREHPWELEDCTIAVIDERHHEQVRYGRVDRSSSMMHNEVALQTQATIFEIVHREYAGPYDTAQEIKIVQAIK